LLSLVALFSPDKHPQNPSAAKRFERLGLINKILRDERKDRYDHFLSTGFPKWRGTGYYYERFRPGLISVIIGVLGLTVLVEHMIKRLNFSRDVGRASQLRKAALFQAWGPRFFQVLYNAKGAPAVAQEKKLKLQVAFLPELPVGPTPAEVEKGTVDWDTLEKEVRKSALASGGTPSRTAEGAPRTVDVLVTRESDGEAIVWLLDPSSGEFSELNEEKMLKPTFRESWPLRIVQRFKEGKAAEAVEEVAAEGAEAVAKAKESVASSTGVKKNKGGKKR
jgi:hypothetical protein